MVATTSSDAKTPIPACADRFCSACARDSRGVYTDHDSVVDRSALWESAKPPEQTKRRRKNVLGAELEFV